MTESLRALFDPERFAREGHAVVELLAAHLGRMLGPNPGRVTDAPPLAEVLERFPGPGCEVFDGDGLWTDLVRRALEDAIRLHHPAFMGHQVSAPLPVAALASLVSAMLNNGMAIYEMGPAGVATERRVLEWIARLLGFDASADGVLTSGGSLGNLTALLCMRAVMLPDSIRRGTEGQRPAILASAAAHYSMERAVGVMGWGESGIATVPVDRHQRMISEDLPKVLARARADGLSVLGVAASACTTATGSYDPLDAIGTFCEANDLWFHVDAAHGGAAALSPRYRHLVAGIERADSVVFDAHKMLMVPALVTAVLFREGARSFETFTQHASYLQAHPDSSADPGLRTLECTKRMMGFEAYVAIALSGEKGLREHVETTFGLARELAALLEDADDFELLMPPDANIVCFRHRRGADDGDALQEAIRADVVRKGHHYLVLATVGGRRWLRCTLMNPFSTRDHLLELLDALRGSGASS